LHLRGLASEHVIDFFLSFCHFISLNIVNIYWCLITALINSFCHLLPSGFHFSESLSNVTWLNISIHHEYFSNFLTKLLLTYEKSFVNEVVIESVFRSHRESFMEVFIILGNYLSNFLPTLFEWFIKVNMITCEESR